MVMEMLAAGGIEPAGHTSERSHELVGDDLTVLVPRLAASGAAAAVHRRDGTCRPHLRFEHEGQFP